MSQVCYSCSGSAESNIELQIPGDKSISHRSIIFSSLSNSTVTVKNLLLSEDVICTMNAFREMGVKIEEQSNGHVIVHGVGLRGLKKPSGPLYMGNSGTACRLLLGVLSAQPFDTVITGDTSLSQRPMGRVIEPLTKMGANIQSNQGRLPITIKPALNLKAIEYKLPVVSAQVKSSILLAGLYAEGTTIVTEITKTRTYTEDMIKTYIGGVGGCGNVISVEKASDYQINEISVPSDISSAAFFVVGTLLKKSSEIVIRGLDYSHQRNGLIRNLLKMGAHIEVHFDESRPDVADLKVSSSKLSGIVMDPNDVGDMIDEFPIFMIAALAADGKTIVTGAQELRVKESDRISTMVEGLGHLDIAVEERSDGFTINGLGSDQLSRDGRVFSHHDHRIAMSFAVSALLLGGPIVIDGAETIKTSFPNFNELIEALGITVQ